MKKILISTENTSDLTKELMAKRDISAINMHYFLDGTEFDGTEQFDSKQFYDAMRNGSMTRTSMLNENDAEEYFVQLLTQGKDIVHIAFASACSGSYFSLFKVAERLNSQNTNKIYVVDSLCESGGQGLLVTLVDDFAQSGADAKTVFEYAEKTKHQICHYFCVDSTKYLARGGRISKAAGIIGGVLNIKPVLYTDVDGKLTSLSKELTRKRSLTKLVDHMREKFDRTSTIVYICSADSDEDANYVAGLVKMRFDIQPQLFPLGPVIGSHSGPGTVALFFTSANRLIKK